MKRFQTTMKTLARTLLYGAAFLLPLAACQDEEFGYDIADVRESLYAKNFSEMFGDVDPNHTWNMATTAHVHINVPGANGYTVRIFTEVPANADAVLLYGATMTGDNLDAAVDVKQGSQYVYVEIFSDFGVYLADGYYAIDEEGNVEVSKTTTRAASAAPTLKGFTQDVTRMQRIWNPLKEKGNPYLWTYGFDTKAIYVISDNYPANFARPAGWLIHANEDKAKGRPDLRTDKDYSSETGPRVLDVTAKENGAPLKAFGKDKKRAIYLRQAGSYAQYGHDESLLFIPKGKYKFSVALAPWGTTNEQELNITLYRRKSDNSAFEEGKSLTTCTLKEIEDMDQVSDPNKRVCTEFNADFEADGGQYYIEFKITKGYEWSGLVLAGFKLETMETNIGSDAFIKYSEQIDTYLTYRDVLGGGVNRWAINTNNILPSNQSTYRNNLNNGGTYYKYRTYNVDNLIDNNGMPMIAEGSMGPFYIINSGSSDDGSAILEQTEKVMYKDMFPLYGMYKSSQGSGWTNSPFREGVNHIDPYFTDTKLTGESGDWHTAEVPELEMKHDAQCVTLGPINANGVTYDGSVRVKLMGIGTDWNNAVGYFYYPKGLESKYMDNINGEPTLNFGKVAKVIIRKDMQKALIGDNPSSMKDDANTAMGKNEGLFNRRYNRLVNGCFALGLSDSDLNDLKTSGDFETRWNNDYCEVRTFVEGVKQYRTQAEINAAANSTFDAPVYKLPFFGGPDANGNFNLANAGAGTYAWPKDYVIGFFGIRADANFACELARVYTSSASVQRNYFNDLPRGSAFSYKGKNYIGLEDEWDYDNNDFLFEITGIEPITPDITPQDDPLSSRTTQDWVVACEDLGGTWDYDFNDLVWAVSKEVEGNKPSGGSWTFNTKLYFQALAAGGTLEAVVEYNNNNVLDASNAESGWTTIGEIHNLVKRTSGTKVNGEYQTPTNVQLNVKAFPNEPNPELGDCGERRLLTTLTNDNGNDLTMQNILTHFRVRVILPNGSEYYLRNVGAHLQNVQNHPDDGTHNHLNSTDDGLRAPQFILLPMGWRWPKEAVCITDAYPSFTDWTKSQGNYPNWVNDWNNSVSAQDKVIINPLRY